MKNYPELLYEFKNISLELENLIQKFPSERREEIIFDKWSLKNVVSHLNHWMIHDIDCLENLIQGKEPFWEPDVEEFNQSGVEARRNKSWDEIYSEFIDLRKKTIDLYTKLPTVLQNKKFWNNKNETPTEFLKEDNAHWRDEHIASLNDFFKQ
jgi:hypothetical protein